MMPSPILSAIHQFSTQWSNLFVNMTHSLHLFFHILKGILIPNELSFDFVLNQEFFSIFSANLIFTNRFSSSSSVCSLNYYLIFMFVLFILIYCIVLSLVLTLEGTQAEEVSQESGQLQISRSPGPANYSTLVSGNRQCSFLFAITFLSLSLSSIVLIVTCHSCHHYDSHQSVNIIKQIVKKHSCLLSLCHT